ncbi:MAG: serine/threonine protein kinase [Labilithrix sp.]|nr:serine/threonine protein kinase [Labilithrix sp.]MCW5815189.1 serine/threonine protein kinase [Labilithrix sp.]
MGTVFAATHKNNGMRAAIKVLHAEYSRDSDTKSRFIQEGYAANQVGHAGVVRILDDDVTEEGAPFLVMELLEGELLEQRRIHAGGKLPVDEVVEVAEQLLDVIVAAHAKGIVHRDIKPDNIFVTNQGLLKVLDFGFARMRDSQRTERTATGFLLGTPGFMAPEQAAGHSDNVDARTDIWAIGATLFVLLTGQPVHEGESAAEMLVAAANFPVRPVGEIERGIPVKLRQTVDRALAFDRKDRWPDARSMLLAIRSLPGRRESPADDEGRTLMRPSPVDDARTVMRPSPAAGSVHEDATVMGKIEELPAEALESIYTPTSPLKAPPEAHPADQEQRTLAIDPDGPTIGVRAPSPSSTTQKVEKFPGAEEPTEHTVMMMSRPLPQNPLLAPPQPHVPPPSPSYPDLQHQQFQPPITGPLPRLATTNMTSIAHPKGGKGGSVLVFIAVAGITMVVVILTGLLVIIGTE